MTEIVTDNIPPVEMTTIASGLTEEELIYIETHQKELQIGVDNCYLVIDPNQKTKPEELFSFINSPPTEKMYVYFFITNTCELVEGLEKIHIEKIC